MKAAAGRSQTAWKGRGKSQCLGGGFGGVGWKAVWEVIDYLTVSQQLIPLLAAIRLAFPEVFGVQGFDPHLAVLGVFPHGHHVVGVDVAELLEGRSHCWSIVNRVSRSKGGQGVER